MRRIVSIAGAAALLVGAGVAEVAAQPTPPTRFFGTVTMDGRAAADGTTITAFVGGNACGTGTVTGGSYTLDVASASTKSGCGTDGASVTFQIGSMSASQTGTFRTGSFVPLNLAASAQATPTPTPVRTPTPAPTPARTPTPAPTPARTPTPAPTPARTPTPAATPARTPTPVATIRPQQPAGPGAAPAPQRPAAPAAPAPALPRTGAGVTDNGSLWLLGGLLSMLLAGGSAAVAVTRRR